MRLFFYKKIYQTWIGIMEDKEISQEQLDLFRNLIKANK